jgi:hypothetical protein
MILETLYGPIRIYTDLRKLHNKERPTIKKYVTLLERRHRDYCGLNVGYLESAKILLKRIEKRYIVHVRNLTDDVI